MVKLTMIARVTDGLPLAEGLDDGRDMQDAEFYKQQVKALFKNLSRGQNEASRMSVETGPYIFQYPPFALNIHDLSLILSFICLQKIESNYLYPTCVAVRRSSLSLVVVLSSFSLGLFCFSFLSFQVLDLRSSCVGRYLLINKTAYDA